MRLNGNVSMSLVSLMLAAQQDPNGSPTSVTGETVSEEKAKRNIFLIAFPNPLNREQVRVTGSPAALEAEPIKILETMGFEEHDKYRMSEMLQTGMRTFGRGKIDFKIVAKALKRLGLVSYTLDSMLSPAEFCTYVLGRNPTKAVGIQQIKAAFFTACGFKGVNGSGIARTAMSYLAQQGVKLDGSFQVIFADTGETHPENVDVHSVKGWLYQLAAGNTAFEAVPQGGITGVPEGWSSFLIDPASAVENPENSVAYAIKDALNTGIVKAYRIGYNHEQLHDAALEGGLILFTATWTKNVVQIHGSKAVYANKVKSIENNWGSVRKDIKTLITSATPTNGATSESTSDKRALATAGAR